RTAISATAAGAAAARTGIARTAIARTAIARTALVRARTRLAVLARLARALAGIGLVGLRLHLLGPLLDRFEVVGQLVGVLLQLAFAVLERLGRFGHSLRAELVGVRTQLLLLREQLLRGSLGLGDVLELLLQLLGLRRVVLLLALLLRQLVDLVAEALQLGDLLEQLLQVGVAVLQQLECTAQVGLDALDDLPSVVPLLAVEE